MILIPLCSSITDIDTKASKILSDEQIISSFFPSGFDTIQKYNQRIKLKPILKEIRDACGKNAFFTINDNGEIIIHGTGDTFDYSSSYASPLYAHRNSIIMANIGSGITSIGNLLFFQCSELKSLTISNTVTFIGSRSFFCCTNLRSIVIPNSVTLVKGEAFCLCTSLQNVTFSYQMTSISVSMFEKCYSIQHIVLPNSIKSIGLDAFCSCINLQTIMVPDELESLGRNLFLGCTNLQSFVIPIKITSIPFALFSDCLSLASITIPDDVTVIESKSFYSCLSLTTIPFPPNLEIIESYAICNCNSLTKIHLPASIISIEHGALARCINLRIIEIDSNPTNIYYRCINNVLFTYNSSIILQYCIGDTATEYSIPLGVTTIAEMAFASSPNLETVRIPETITKVDFASFYKCNRLTNLFLSSNLNIIGAMAFSSCLNLQSIEIPASVTSIEKDAFSDCPNLENVIYLGENSPDCHSAFRNSTKVASIGVFGRYLSDSFCEKAIYDMTVYLFDDLNNSEQLFSTDDSIEESSDLVSTSDLYSLSHFFSLSRVFTSSCSFTQISHFSESHLFSKSSQFTQNSLSAGASYSPASDLSSPLTIPTTLFFSKSFRFTPSNVFSPKSLFSSSKSFTMPVSSAHLESQSFYFPPTPSSTLYKTTTFFPENYNFTSSLPFSCSSSFSPIATMPQSSTSHFTPSSSFSHAEISTIQSYNYISLSYTVSMTYAISVSMTVIAAFSNSYIAITNAFGSYYMVNTLVMYHSYQIVYLQVLVPTYLSVILEIDSRTSFNAPRFLGIICGSAAVIFAIGIIIIAIYKRRYQEDLGTDLYTSEDVKDDYANETTSKDLSHSIWNLDIDVDSSNSF